MKLNKMTNKESNNVGFFHYQPGAKKPYRILGENGEIVVKYEKLKHLTNEWEDYTPPSVSRMKSVHVVNDAVVITTRCEIEAKMVKKRIDALRKLEDKGFRFDGEVYFKDNIGVINKDRGYLSFTVDASDYYHKCKLGEAPASKWVKENMELFENFVPEEDRCE